jgi:hypothetical protein
VIARPAARERQRYVFDPNARFYRITRSQPWHTGPKAQAMSESRTGSVGSAGTVYGTAVRGDAVDFAEIVRTRAGSTAYKATSGWQP